MESQNEAIQYADKLVECEQRNRKLIERIPNLEKIFKEVDAEENHKEKNISYADKNGLNNDIEH